MRNQSTETCPLCANHCPADDLKCGRGHGYFERERETTGHRHGHREQLPGVDERKRKRLAVRPSRDSLPYLLLSSSHYLHRMFHEINMEDEKRLFACLDETEQTQLKMLLQKLLLHWGRQKRKTEE